jgi:hypothetical protein
MNDDQWGVVFIRPGSEDIVVVGPFASHEAATGYAATLEIESPTVLEQIPSFEVVAIHSPDPGSDLVRTRRFADMSPSS